jgi:hypothetical protein
MKHQQKNFKATTYNYSLTREIQDDIIVNIANDDADIGNEIQDDIIDRSHRRI